MEVFDRAKSIFQKVIKSYHNGIPGVRIFDSGVPGPTVGVVAMLHGNEPCGLAVYELLEENPGILDRGKVIFCLGNIFAAERYFATDDGNERLRFRSLLVNMNRIPVTVLQKKVLQPSDEEDRFLKILEILSDCETVIDFHSTSLPGGRMLIPNDRWSLDYDFPVEKVIKNIFNVMVDKTLIGLLGERGVAGAVVENGVHEEWETWTFSQYFLVSTLVKLKLVRYPLLLRRSDLCVFSDRQAANHVRVLHSIWFPNDNFRMVKNFENFEPVKAGQELAFDPISGEKIVSPIDGVILFPFPVGHEKGTSEEACFIGREITFSGNSLKDFHE